MTTFLSGDPTMYKAYNEGKDLYAMIACSAFNNKYQENLEFWPAGTKLSIDGKEIVSGTGEERQEELSQDKSISVKCYEMLDTPDGFIAASNIRQGMKINSSNGILIVASVNTADDVTVIYFE